MDVKGKDLLYEIARIVFRAYIKYKYNVFVEGRENIYDIPYGEPFVMASRHINPLDPPIIQDYIPGVVHTLAKQDLFRTWWRELGLKSLYVYPLKKKNREALIELIDLSVNLLSSGKNLSLYPEGQVTVDGHLREFMSGIARIPAKAREKTEKPIWFLPASIFYAPHHHIKNSDLFITFGKAINIKEYLTTHNVKELQLLAREEISKLTKVTCESLVAESLITKNRMNIDELVNSVFMKYIDHKMKGHNIDNRLMDKNLIENKIFSLTKIPCMMISIKNDIIEADTEFIPGYFFVREEIIGKEKKIFDIRTITYYHYKNDGLAAFLCKRGYPFKETNINLVKNRNGYELIIEKVEGKKIKKNSFTYPDFETSKNKMDEYISKNLLLEDQVNMLQFLANEISHFR